MDGHVVGIYTAPGEGKPVTARDEVLAVAGRGIEGDRYFESNEGTHDPADEITLIDATGVREASEEHGVVFAPGEHRRNVEIDGLDLPSLVGTTIQVGEVQVEVLEKNPPCKYLSELTGKPVLTVLRHQGGVRGRIVTTGHIRAGDVVSA